MNGLNRVMLMGYLGRDPERLTAKSGKIYVKLSVATHHNRRLDNGDKESTTVWHKVSVWGKTAERCQTYLHKGSAVFVDGHLTHFNYQQDDGKTAKASSVVAREVHFLAKGKEESTPMDEIDSFLESDRSGLAPGDAFAPAP